MKVDVKAAPRQFYKRSGMTLVQVLVAVAIIAVLIALCVAPVKWASSGDIEIPVHVLVFDVRTFKPISGACVEIKRGFPWLGDKFLPEFKVRYLTLERAGSLTAK